MLVLNWKLNLFGKLKIASECNFASFNGMRTNNRFRSQLDLKRAKPTLFLHYFKEICLLTSSECRNVGTFIWLHS